MKCLCEISIITHTFTVAFSSDVTSIVVNWSKYITQHKLDQCFGHIKNVIVIADDIMIVGKRHNHSEHDQALTILLHTARS